MIEVVWEYVVKEEARGQFELAYGPGGAWSKLFAPCPGFRGISLLRDTKNPERYLSVEFWETEARQQEMLTDHNAQYAELEAAIADWTESSTQMGAFRVLAEATVHPRGRARRSKARGARRTTR